MNQIVDETDKKKERAGTDDDPAVGDGRIITVKTKELIRPKIEQISNYNGEPDGDAAQHRCRLLMPTITLRLSHQADASSEGADQRRQPQSQPKGHGD